MVGYFLTLWCNQQKFRKNENVWDKSLLQCILCRFAGDEPAVRCACRASTCTFGLLPLQRSLLQLDTHHALYGCATDHLSVTMLCWLSSGDCVLWPCCVLWCNQSFCSGLTWSSLVDKCKVVYFISHSEESLCCDSSSWWPRHWSSLHTIGHCDRLNDKLI